MREERLWSTPLHYAFTYPRREVPLHVAPKAQSLPSPHSVTSKQRLRKKEPEPFHGSFSSLRLKRCPVLPGVAVFRAFRAGTRPPPFGAPGAGLFRSLITTP